MNIEKLAKAQGKSIDHIKGIIQGLHEFNPMMGHRGCRLSVTYPEIAVMQTRAVIRAAIKVQKAHPEWTLVPEIMIPLVGEIKELKYVKKTVVETAESDPFAKVDQKGVGKLMKMAIDLGRPVNPKLHIGVCGEHGGDPSSVEFFNKLGLDYVSCSPFRVPIARLAAAQSAIKMAEAK